MSAIGGKADMRWCSANVCFWPKGDIPLPPHGMAWTLLGHLVLNEPNDRRDNCPGDVAANCLTQDWLMSAFAVTSTRQAFHKSCSTIERNSTPIIATIKSVTCPLALNDVSHEAGSASGFGGSGGSGFGGGWFFMLGSDCQGHRLINYGLRSSHRANRHSLSRRLAIINYGDFTMDHADNGRFRHSLCKSQTT